MHDFSKRSFNTVIFAWFSNHVGGLEQLIVNRARWFVSHGFKVIIVTTDGPMTSKYRESGANVHNLSRYENDFNCLGSGGLSRFIQKILQSVHEPHVCMVGFDKKSLWFLNELARRLPAAEVRLGVEYVALKIFYGFTSDELSALGHADRIICMNEASRLYLEKVHNLCLPATDIIPLPVPPLATSYSAKFEEDHPVVISACRLEEMKEYVFGLIKGAGAFFERHPRGQLLVIGDGSYREELEKAAVRYGNKIRFLGTVDPADYAATIRQGSVFVGMGLASVQAGQLGLPVVIATAYDRSFSSPGTLSQQAVGDFGEEVPGNLRPGWDVVLPLVSNRELWLLESEASRRHATEIFDYEKNMARYCAKLESLRTGCLLLNPPPMPAGSFLKRLVKKSLIKLGVR